ncbi:two-component system response regulator FixJ [Nitrobacteraceae bacterium AZCC 1564]
MIDDDPDVLSSLRFLLETEGFYVCTFKSASSLLNLDSPASADCYVIDYRMEPVDGIDLARRLRERYPGASIILITSSPDETVKADAHRAGIHTVLVKPHLDESLPPAIRAAIERNRINSTPAKP